MSDHDACTNACQEAACGDAVIVGVEQCDDGNRIDNDNCTNACEVARCGDAVVGQGEECDDGNERDDDECNNCRLPRCGTAWFKGMKPVMMATG